MRDESAARRCGSRSYVLAAKVNLRRLYGGERGELYGGGLQGDSSS